MMPLTMACSILLSMATTLAPEALSRQKSKATVLPTPFYSEYPAAVAKVLHLSQLFFCLAFHFRALCP